MWRAVSYSVFLQISVKHGGGSVTERKAANIQGRVLECGPTQPESLPAAKYWLLSSLELSISLHFTLVLDQNLCTVLYVEYCCWSDSPNNSQETCRAAALSKRKKNPITSLLSKPEHFVQYVYLPTLLCAPNGSISAGPDTCRCHQIASHWGWSHPSLLFSSFMFATLVTRE